MLRLSVIFVTLLLMTGVLQAADLTVGTRLMLNEGFKVTKTSRNDYLLINDVEVFLAPCKVYVFRQPSQSFTTNLERVYVAEYNVKTIAAYKEAGWHLENTIDSSAEYSYMPNFYAKKVFAVEKISKTNKSYIRVIDRGGMRYVLLLPKNIEGTFTVLD